MGGCEPEQFSSDRIQCTTFVNTAMKLSFTQKVVNALSI
jgi:hypothetical protein